MRGTLHWTPDRGQIHHRHERPPIANDILRAGSAKRGMSITTPNPIGKTVRSLPAFYKEATRSLAAINFTYSRR